MHRNSQRLHQRGLVERYGVRQTVQHELRQDDVFRESAVYVGSQETGVRAQLVMARAAITAGLARHKWLDAYPIADGERAHTGAHTLHDTTDLVSGRDDDERHVTAQAMQVATAHATERDPD